MTNTITNNARSAADPQSSSLVHKIHIFYIELHRLVANVFPKQARYTIGKRLEDATLEVLELAISAYRARDRRKLSILRQIDAKLELIQHLIRASYHIKAIDEKQYISLEERVKELGRMTGGWIQSEQKK